MVETGFVQMEPHRDGGGQIQPFQQIEIKRAEIRIQTGIDLVVRSCRMRMGMRCRPRRLGQRREISATKVSLLSCPFVSFRKLS